MSIHKIKSLKLQNSKCWAVDCKKNGLLSVATEDKVVKIVKISHGIDGKYQFNLVSSLDETVHKKAVRSVAWRPQSQPICLAAGSFDSTVSIWSGIPLEYRDDDLDEETSPNLTINDDNNSYNSNLNDQMELMAIIEGHENEIKGVAWSHDGIFLATCSRDKSVWIWETDEAGEEFECVSVLQEHSQDIKHVVWHPTKYLLASSSYDDSVRLWKEFDDDWECVAVLNGHEGTVWSSDFEKSNNDPAQTRLCSCSDDSTVRVWKFDSMDEDGQENWICESVLPTVHKRQIYSVSWAENGLIASAGSDGTLVIYKENTDTHEWEIIAQESLIHGIYEVNNVKWIKIDGKEILVTAGDDGCVNVWEYN